MSCLSIFFFKKKVSLVTHPLPLDSPSLPPTRPHQPPPPCQSVAPPSPAPLLASGGGRSSSAGHLSFHSSSGAFLLLLPSIYCSSFMGTNCCYVSANFFCIMIVWHEIILLNSLGCSLTHHTSISWTQWLRVNFKFGVFAKIFHVARFHWFWWDHLMLLMGVYHWIEV